MFYGTRINFIMLPNLFILFLLAALCVQHTNQNSLGGGAALYDANDKIVLLNTTNFQSTICGSSTAWLVEFYSSWCGHCIHFAPTFKSLAEDVYSWRGVMAVAAIDCAVEANMAVCREYEIMGYPTIKFFSPNTPAGDMGQERQSRDKTIPAIEKDMIKFLAELQSSGNVSRIGAHWPKLGPATVSGSTVPELWSQGAKYAVLLIEKAESDVAGHVILDLSDTVNTLNIPLTVTKIEINAQSQKLMDMLKVSSEGGMVAVTPDMKVVEAFSGVTMERKQMVTAVKNFVWKHSGELSIKNGASSLKTGQEDAAAEKKDSGEQKQVKTASRKEVMTRRYRAHMSDLEKAIVYAISHEVAQHSAITGVGLVALQQLVTVLDKYFPARIEMALLLRELRSWVFRHQDTIRGEDLSAWFQSYRTRHSFHVSDTWLGCRGSEDRYGGYPCGLWSVWHVLTLGQAEAGAGEAGEVLAAMKMYIQEFFGCRECARHFDQAIEGGKLIENEVKNHEDAVLLLWLVHNKVNIRLSGDISEDPVFPKQKFPSKEFCSACYDGRVTGNNLWAEFNKAEVFKFLRNLYSKEKLSSMGLSEKASGDGAEHGLAVVPQVEENIVESLDMSNYNKVGSSNVYPIDGTDDYDDDDDDDDDTDDGHDNTLAMDGETMREYLQEENSTNFIFFNGADISICFVLWGISAVLLILIYLKFVAGAKFSNSYMFNSLKRKTSSRNPLIGKV